MAFTFDWYEKLLLELGENGYSFCNYHNYHTHKKPCILRHDIDMSLEAATTISDIEKQNNVKSTYFILLNTGMYNVCFSKSIKLIEHILNNGHDIGLHYDETQYSDGDISIHVQQEISLLKKVLGVEITSVSMHRPSKTTLDANYTFGDNIVNSYGYQFFKEFKYLSDSRMRWKENIEEIICSKRYSRIHLLTHPIWYSESEKTIQDMLRQFVQSASTERYSLLSENIRDLQDLI